MHVWDVEAWRSRYWRVSVIWSGVDHFAFSHAAILVDQRHSVISRHASVLHVEIRHSRRWCMSSIWFGVDHFALLHTITPVGRRHSCQRPTGVRFRPAC